VGATRQCCCTLASAVRRMRCFPTRSSLARLASAPHHEFLNRELSDHIAPGHHDNDNTTPTSSPTSPSHTTMSKQTKSNKPAGGKSGQGRSAIEDVVAREYTIHLHKHVRSV